MSLRDRWQRIVGFVEEQEDATSIALTRIAVGTTLAAHFIRLMYTGGAQFVWTAVADGGFAARPGWLEYVGGNTPSAVFALCMVVIAASLMVALGLFTRASIVVALLAFRACTEMNGEARSGYDSLLVNLLFLLFLSGCGRRLSLDALIFKKPHVVARWPRMLFVLQIALLYGGTALMKGSAGWIPGGDADALWFILHQPMWSRLESLPTWSFFLTQIATTTTWFWELTGPLCALAIWFKDFPPRSKFWGRIHRLLERVRFRELWLLAGVGVHVGIEMFMEVGVFTPASLALYFCALRPDEWRAFGAWAKKKIGFTSS